MRSQWTRTSVGVYTQPLKTGGNYKDEEKQTDGLKVEFNDRVCASHDDLHRYWSEMDSDPRLRALVLDGYHLVTTGRLVNDCQMDLGDLDMVSHSVAFKRGTSANFHTGELSSFLDQKTVPTDGSDKYDLAILDFCGSWPGDDQGPRRCVELLFQRNLLEDISVLEVTLSFRSGPKRMDYMHQIMTTAIADIQQISQEADYLVQVSEFFTNGNIFYLFFKVIHPQRSMSYDGGITGGRKRRYATHWWTESVPDRKKQK